MPISAELYAAKQKTLAYKGANAFIEWCAKHPTATLGQVKATLQAVGSMYGEASAELAALYYSELRGEVEGLEAFLPTPSEPPGVAYTDAVATKNYNPDKPNFGLESSLQSIIQLAGRWTITTNTDKDPAKPHWARVPIGKTCAWCLMLAGRGAVYWSKEAAGGSAKGTNRYHDDCDCQPVPVFAGQKPPYDADRLYSMYRDARDQASSGSAASVTASMRSMYPDLVTDGHVSA